MKLEFTDHVIQPSRSVFELRESPPENTHSPHSMAIHHNYPPQRYRNEEKAIATIHQQSPLYHRGNLDIEMSSVLLLNQTKEWNSQLHHQRFNDSIKQQTTNQKK